MVNEPRMNEENDKTEELIRLSFFTDTAKSMCNCSLPLLNSKTNELILYAGNRK